MDFGDDIEGDGTDLLDDEELDDEELDDELSMDDDDEFLADDLSLDESDDGMMIDEDGFSDEEPLDDDLEEAEQSIILDESMEVKELEPDEMNEVEDEDSLLPDLDDGLSDLDSMEGMGLDADETETGDLAFSNHQEVEEPVIELSEVPFEEDMDLGADMFSDDTIDDDIELSELEEMDDEEFLDDSDMDLSEPLDEDQSPIVSIQENSQVDLYNESKEIETGKKSDAVIDKEILFKLPHLLTVEIGKANLKGEDITNLTYGSVIELDRKKGEPVDIILGSKIIANGEVVQINEEQLGVRITRINY